MKTNVTSDPIVSLIIACIFLFTGGLHHLRSSKLRSVENRSYADWPQDRSPRNFTEDEKVRNQLYQEQER
jgi:hypothetical protein